MCRAGDPAAALAYGRLPPPHRSNSAMVGLAAHSSAGQAELQATRLVLRVVREEFLRCKTKAEQPASQRHQARRLRRRHEIILPLMLNCQLTPWYTSVGSRENAFLGFYEVLNEEAPVPRIETKTPHRGKAGRKVERNNSGLNDAKCRCAPRPSGLHRMREFPDTLLDTTDSWPRDAANRISAKRSSFRFERHRSVNERSRHRS